LTRLRLALGDALFVRASGRMRPTLRAERLASVVQPAVAAIQAVLKDEDSFDPAHSRMQLRLHMSDIGEARLLPELMASRGAESTAFMCATMSSCRTGRRIGC